MAEESTDGTTNADDNEIEDDEEEEAEELDGDTDERGLIAALREVYQRHRWPRAPTVVDTRCRAPGESLLGSAGFCRGFG